MKLIIRSVVVLLAITGAIATTSANGSSVKASVLTTKTSAHPVPACAPNTGDCGMGDW